MSLKPCRECKMEVSAAAPVCQHCGIKNPIVTLSSVVPDLIKGGIGLFILYLLFSQMAGSQSSDASATPQQATAGTESKTPTGTAYGKVETDFWGCVKYHMKGENLPFYDARTETSTLNQLAGECSDTYFAALKACLALNRPISDQSISACKEKLTKAAFEAVAAAK